MECLCEKEIKIREYSVMYDIHVSVTFLCAQSYDIRMAEEANRLIVTLFRTFQKEHREPPPAHHKRPPPPYGLPYL